MSGDVLEKYVKPLPTAYALSIKDGESLTGFH
jgi:hypothetical protein